MGLFKYYDCSINNVSNKQHDINSMGPIENDIMKDLERYSYLFGFKRTYNYKEADIIITNTTYPNKILEWSSIHSIPKIKRMDGIYWQDKLKYKNGELNKAALQSDKVIFISKYSKNTLKELYDIDVNNEVILNNVDDNIFYPRKKDKFRLVSSCTNWDREGKRLDELIKFANNISDEIHLIGKCEKELPKNIIKHGYMESLYSMSNIIGESSIFISLFYRDAGSKVTCQAIKCHLPVLYVTSGGLKELVNGNGVMVEDDAYMGFKMDTPHLDIGNIITKYKELKYVYKDIVNNFNDREKYYDTIGMYFSIMKSFL